MLTVNISTLKNQLSAFLKKVRKGEEILIMDRTQVIAKVSRVFNPSVHTNEEARITDLEQRGILRRASGKKLTRKWFEQHPPIPIKGSAVEALLKEREEGW